MRHRVCFALPADGEHLLATSWQHIFCIEVGKRYRRDVALIVRQQRLKLNLSGRLAIKLLQSHRISAVVTWTIS